MAQVTQEIRTDRDLATAGLQEKSNAGATFDPYQERETTDRSA